MFSIWFAAYGRMVEFQIGIVLQFLESVDDGGFLVVKSNCWR